MGDILRYKKPGNESQTLIGRFKKVNDFVGVSGFVVTNFSGENKYVFEEDSTTEQLHFLNNSMGDMDKSSYLLQAEEFIRELTSDDLQKLILSRSINIQHKIDPTSYFVELCETYPDAFVYLISSELFGTWIGASPEVLIKSKGEEKHVMALAGTRQTESQVEWTEKEFQEHAYVVDFLKERLSALSVEKMDLSERYDAIAGPVKHLRTDIRFNSDVSDYHIVDKIHPTPAVAGIPQDRAVQHIIENEGYERGLYTGYLGLLGSDSELYVNLRCMQVYNDSISVYVGGGLTKDSIPEKEWEETQNKAKTLLQIIDLM